MLTLPPVSNAPPISITTVSFRTGEILTKTDFAHLAAKGMPLTDKEMVCAGCLKRIEQVAEFVGKFLSVHSTTQNPIFRFYHVDCLKALKKDELLKKASRASGVLKGDFLFMVKPKKCEEETAKIGALIKEFVDREIFTTKLE